VTVHWVINPHPDKPNTQLADKVKSLPWLDGEPSVWVASEFETMRNLRRYFKQEHNLARDHLYVSSYWKMGDTDEGHKAAKKIDPEAE
jgi:NADPH-dependent ferric siderophore reductase